MNRVYFDLETQNYSYEIGGWFNIAAAGLALAVTWDEQEKFMTWRESQVIDLVRELSSFDVIIGYNTNRFDFAVLSGYTDIALFLVETSFDIMVEIRLQTGKLYALDDIGKRNLDLGKLGKSSGAVELFREGRIDELEAYTQRDVELTRMLVELWETRGYLWVSNDNFVTWPGMRYTAYETEGYYQQ